MKFELTTYRLYSRQNSTPETLHHCYFPLHYNCNCQCFCFVAAAYAFSAALASALYNFQLSRILVPPSNFFHPRLKITIGKFYSVIYRTIHRKLINIVMKTIYPFVLSDRMLTVTVLDENFNGGRTNFSTRIWSAVFALFICRITHGFGPL